MWIDDSSDSSDSSDSFWPDPEAQSEKQLPRVNRLKLHGDVSFDLWHQETTGERWNRWNFMN